MITDILVAQSDVVRTQQAIIDRLFLELLQYKEADEFEDEVLQEMSSIAKRATEIA